MMMRTTSSWCVVLLSCFLIDRGASLFSRPACRIFNKLQVQNLILFQSSNTLLSSLQIENITKKAIDISQHGYKGAENVAIVNASPNIKEFVPASIVDSSQKEKWDWYQNRNIQEERLKNAITRNEVRIFSLFE